MSMLHSIRRNLVDIHFIGIVVLNVFCSNCIQAQVGVMLFEIRDNSGLDSLFITSIGCRLNFEFDNAKPVKQEIGEVWGGAHQARIDAMRWIVRSPADGDRVVQRCADSAVD